MKMFYKHKMESIDMVQANVERIGALSPQNISTL